MSADHNTLFLRLAGAMQSWGTASRFQLRRTDAYPSKSGVFGLLLCAQGVPRQDSPMELERLAPLMMGVRVDRPGTMDWDYHTAGAKIGIRTANGEGPKETASTHEYETLLSRRQYLYDASFLVALLGDSDTVARCAAHLQNPVWPVFLGRKCCVPAEPVFSGTGSFATLTEALSSQPWRPALHGIDGDGWGRTRMLDVYSEHPPGSPAPPGARLVYDVPKKFGFWSHSPRWIVKRQVNVPAEPQARRASVGSRAPAPDRTAMSHRLRVTDGGLCVFCKAPAAQVHHVSYENYGHETDADLRALCKLCHDACTMLEYGHDMRTRRVDPSDPAQRDIILSQIRRLLAERRLGQRRELLTAARVQTTALPDPGPAAAQREGN